jgi:single-stranded-DNA-specific exonuclease
MGWPAPRVAVGPVDILKADLVGNGGHLRVIARGADGASFKGIAFRAAEGELGQTLLACQPGKRLWLAGRARRNDWNGRSDAELHIDDAAWA